MAFDQKYLDEAESYKSLGPAYFDARNFTDALAERFHEELFLPMVKKFSDDLYSELETTVRNSLISDATVNVQGEIWRMVDNMVEALLSGERWALDRFVLNDRYDHQKIRGAVAKLVPVEVQNIRIAELADENKRLSERLAGAEGRYG